VVGGPVPELPIPLRRSPCELCWWRVTKPLQLLPGSSPADLTSPTAAEPALRPIPWRSSLLAKPEPGRRLVIERGYGANGLPQAPGRLCLPAGSPGPKTLVTPVSETTLSRWLSKRAAAPLMDQPGLPRGCGP